MRRYLQFRLRSALVLMSICSLPCCWIGASLRQWQAEQRALAAIGPALVEDAGQPFLSLL